MQKTKSAPVHSLRTQIPEPSLLLQEGGRKVYGRWSALLIEAGDLTELDREVIESLALCVDQINQRIAAGKPVPKAFMEARQASTRRLEKRIGDLKGLAEGAKPSGDNHWAAYGFAKREQERRHGEA